MISFANLENVMTAMLKIHLGRRLDPEGESSASMRLASTIYGAMRFKVSRDAVKRLMRVEMVGEEAIQVAGKLWDQIGNIQSLRDMIAHQSLEPREAISDEWILTEFFTDRHIDEPKRYRVKTIEIGFASSDLIAAAGTISRVIAGGDLVSFASAALPAWRYKPSMLRSLS